MFSQQPRCHYRANQLAEVICQLRFPEILAISAQSPVAFQEAIRAEYPQYKARQEIAAPKLTGTPGNLSVQNPPATVNHEFLSADGVWRINLTGKFISLSCARYHCWEDFAERLDKPLAAFIKIYQPAYFERVGLRYLNFISRQALSLEEIPFRDLIAPCYLGPLGEEDVAESAASRCSIDCELAIRSGCRAKIHAGPGMVKRGGKPDPELKFVLDLDLFLPRKLAVSLSAGVLQTLHSQAYPIFRGAITRQLHEAMEPGSI